MAFVGTSDLLGTGVVANTVSFYLFVVWLRTPYRICSLVFRGCRGRVCTRASCRFLLVPRGLSVGGLMSLCCGWGESRRGRVLTRRGLLFCEL